MLTPSGMLKEYSEFAVRKSARIMAVGISPLTSQAKEDFGFSIFTRNVHFEPYPCNRSSVIKIVFCARMEAGVRPGITVAQKNVEWVGGWMLALGIRRMYKRQNHRSMKAIFGREAQTVCRTTKSCWGGGEERLLASGKEPILASPGELLKTWMLKPYPRTVRP